MFAAVLKVTHNQENVLDLQWLEGGEAPPEDLDSFSRSVAFHLKRLVDERDDQLEVRRATRPFTKLVHALSALAEKYG